MRKSDLHSICHFIFLATSSHITKCLLLSWSPTRDACFCFHFLLFVGLDRAQNVKVLKCKRTTNSLETFLLTDKTRQYSRSRFVQQHKRQLCSLPLDFFGGWLGWVGFLLCVLNKLLCMIICFILIIQQLILCEEYKGILHADKLAWAEEVKRG